MTITFVLTTLILAAWWLERRERERSFARTLEAAEKGREAALGANERERQQWMDERTLLLNRIKPETAQPVLGPVTNLSPAALPPDDDEAFWEDKNALADRMMRQELEAAQR